MKRNHLCRIVQREAAVVRQGERERTPVKERNAAERLLEPRHDAADARGIHLKLRTRFRDASGPRHRGKHFPAFKIEIAFHVRESFFSPMPPV